MWVFLSNAYLSIVASDKQDHLCVRARAKGDIERVFPRAVVTVTPKADYRFRSLIERALVADAMADAAMAIDYGNFKSSVMEEDRHNTYMNVWVSMHRFQTARSFKRKNRK